MASKVDLQQLAVKRDAGAASAAPARRRHLLSRVVLPGVLLIGFVVLIAYAAREVMNPPRKVTVLPVVIAQADTHQIADAPLFRAAGWAEPRPSATLVTAPAEGIVEKLLVVEGQDVKEGDIVAHLVAADAKLALGAADAEVKLREGELASAKASLIGAKAKAENPLHLRADLADAEAALAKIETDLGILPQQLRSAQARQKLAQTDLDAMLKAKGAVAEITIVKARSELEAAEAVIAEVEARQKRLPVEVAALKQKRDTHKLKLERKSDELRQLGEAEAAIKIADARLAYAESLRDAARLRVERMTIRAPAAGRVLALVARPGTRLMGQAPVGQPDASTVLTLYDPNRLQIRVDVRLADVVHVQSGQKVTIESAAMPGKSVEGVVLMATSQADVGKNTLQVKVGVTNPPPTLRPDMLCQVTFLAVGGPQNATGKPSQRLLVPKVLVNSTADGNRVWIADALTRTARSRQIQVGFASGELIEVLSGLESTDRLIVGGRDGIKEGERINVTGEDETLGLSDVSNRTPTGK